MESKVTINVAKDGHHYFKAEVMYQHYVSEKVKTVIDDLKVRFPKSEGFKITAMRWECLGHEVEI